MNFLSFCSVNELFLMTFLAWKPEHMITFLVCVNLFCSFFCTGIKDEQGSPLDISGRESGGDVDGGVVISFKKRLARFHASLT